MPVMKNRSPSFECRLLMKKQLWILQPCETSEEAWGGLTFQESTNSETAALDWSPFDS